YLQHAASGGRQSPDSFGPAPDYTSEVGMSPSALELADVDGDGRLDIVVTNDFSGDVSILRNEGNAPFAVKLRFRAGPGLYGLDANDNRSAYSAGTAVQRKAEGDSQDQGNDHYCVQSRQAPAGVVAGLFDADGVTDLIVTHSGANSFSLLRGSGAGGFLNP